MCLERKDSDEPGGAINVVSGMYTCVTAVRVTIIANPGGQAEEHGDEVRVLVALHGL